MTDRLQQVLLVEQIKFWKVNQQAHSSFLSQNFIRKIIYFTRNY